MENAVAHDAEILQRVILSRKTTLPESVAHEFLAYAFDERDRERMRMLAEKARQGELTDDERRETEGFERVGSFLGILQSKARQALRQVGQPE